MIQHSGYIETVPKGEQKTFCPTEVEHQRHGRYVCTCLFRICIKQTCQRRTNLFLLGAVSKIVREVISLSEIMDNTVDGESTSKMVLSLADVLQFITSSRTTLLVPFASKILFNHEIGKDPER